MTDTFVTTKISNAAFADGSTLSGTWTAEYNPAGLLVAVTSATFTVSGSGGTTTFTSMGTLPYADSPSSTSYEIHSLSSSGGGYSGLYIDWRTENPSSLYGGTPSLYTSVLNSAATSPSTPIRLASDGTTGSGSVPVISGLAATESGTDAAATVPFGNVTVTDPGSTTTNATITLSAGGVATDADGVLSGAGLTKIATGTYSLAFTSPANLTVELQALKFTPTNGQVAAGHTVATSLDLAVNDSNGSASRSTILTVTATCFLRGTMIATPAGETAVEALCPGDLVHVLERGVCVPRPVTWTGGGFIDAADFNGRADAFPIRIRRHAFADNVPHRDLLVTPEHCVATEAGLTPARMLVNGRSILVDRSIHAYGFFHVELESHGILVSEGLATESYLDTGNRGLFEGADATIAARQDVVMAAPLAVAHDVVKPLWSRLAERAAALGLEDSTGIVVLTEQPDLRLLLDDSRELAARWHDGRRHMFHIPRGARPLRLLSRTAIPADVVGPFVDDRRTLGVAVDRLVFWRGLEEQVIPTAGLDLDGWHEPEGDMRWTDGRAALDLPAAQADTFLEVNVVGVMLYPDETRVAAQLYG